MLKDFVRVTFPDKPQKTKAIVSASLEVSAFFGNQLPKVVQPIAESYGWPRCAGGYLEQLCATTVWQLLVENPEPYFLQALQNFQMFLLQVVCDNNRPLPWMKHVLVLVSQLLSVIVLRTKFLGGRRSRKNAQQATRGLYSNVCRSLARKGQATRKQTLCLVDFVKLQLACALPPAASTDHFVYQLGMLPSYIGRGRLLRLRSQSGVTHRYCEHARLLLRVLRGKKLQNDHNRYAKLTSSMAARSFILFFLVLARVVEALASATEVAYISYGIPGCNDVPADAKRSPLRWAHGNQRFRSNKVQRLRRTQQAQGEEEWLDFKTHILEKLVEKRISKQTFLLKLKGLQNVLRRPFHTAYLHFQRVALTRGLGAGPIPPYSPGSLPLLLKWAGNFPWCAS